LTAWYDEALYTKWYDKGYAQRFRIDRVLFEDKSEHQDVLVFENAMYGRVLAIDGIIQTTERDEFAYHEMMVHVPILAHGNASKVLIIGGGDGGIMREALRHPNVSLCHMVDIDDMVVEISKKYLPTLSDGVFENPRGKVVIDDGCKFVKETTEKYDVVIVDSTDPLGPGAVLFTEEFYNDCRMNSRPRSRASARSSRIRASISPRFRPMPAASWPWVGRATMRSIATSRWRPWRSASRRPASRASIIRPPFTRPRSRCRPG
jgi:spermidine synthase